MRNPWGDMIKKESGWSLHVDKEKQWLEKDYFRLVIHTSYGGHLEVFSSISIPNIVIVENTARFSLSHASVQCVFKIVHHRYIHLLLPTLIKIAWITQWHPVCSETHLEMLLYCILSLYRLPLHTSSDIPI